MSNSRRAIGLVLRPPSLKGHSIDHRLPTRQGTRVYQAVHRRSLRPCRVYLPRTSRTSIAGVIDALEQAGIPFQALRLRNGDICFLAEEEPELIAVLPGQSPKGKNRQNYARAFAVSLALGLAIIAVTLWPSESSQRTSTTQPSSASKAPILGCTELLDSSEGAMVAYLETGAASAVLEFEVLTSLQNGGLRSVDAKATCLPDVEGSGDLKASQKWRATLTKSELSWTVTKMTRLDN